VARFRQFERSCKSFPFNANIATFKTGGLGGVSGSVSQGRQLAANAGGQIYSTVAVLDATAFSPTAPTACTGNPTNLNPVPISADVAGQIQAAICAVATSAAGVINARGFDCTTSACELDSDPEEDPSTQATTTRIIQMLIGSGTYNLGQSSDATPVVWGVPTKSELWGEGPSETTIVWNGPDPTLSTKCGANNNLACPVAEVLCMGGGYQLPGDGNRVSGSVLNPGVSNCTIVPPASSNCVNGNGGMDDCETNNPRVLVRDIGISCNGVPHVNGVMDVSAQEQSGVQRYAISGCANGTSGNTCGAGTLNNGSLLQCQVAGIWIQGAYAQNSRGYIQGEVTYGAPSPGVPCGAGGFAYGVFLSGALNTIVGDLTVNGGNCSSGTSITNTAVSASGQGIWIYGVHVQGSTIGVDVAATSTSTNGFVVGPGISCTGSWNPASNLNACVQIENNSPYQGDVYGVASTVGNCGGGTGMGGVCGLRDLTPAVPNGPNVFQGSFSHYIASSNATNLNYQFNGGGNEQDVNFSQFISFTETTAPTAAAGQAFLYADSTAHSLEASYNNSNFFRLPQMIASGTTLVGGSSVTTLTCSTPVSTFASSVVASDALEWAFNAAPGTHWQNVTIYAYPSLNDVNFAVCNPSASTVTPASATINWRVIR